MGAGEICVGFQGERQVNSQDHDAISDKMWWKMCDLGISIPVPLAYADLSRPFVYERRFGVFLVSSGHQAAMALLLAFRHGSCDPVDVAKTLGISRYSSSEMADLWLRTTVGGAFRSGVGEKIQLGSRKGLTPLEYREFADAQVVFPHAPL